MKVVGVLGSVSGAVAVLVAAALWLGTAYSSPNEVHFAACATQQSCNDDCFYH